jgi:hypothetical protein
MEGLGRGAGFLFLGRGDKRLLRTQGMLILNVVRYVILPSDLYQS